MVVSSAVNGSVSTALAQPLGLTVAEASERLGLSKVAVRHKIRRGSLPAFKDAEGEWRVPLDALEAAQAAAPTAEYAAAQEVVQAAVQGDEFAPAPTPGEALAAALAAAQATEVRRLEETLALVREELEVRRREQEIEREAHRREVEQLHTLLAQAHQLALPAPRPEALPETSTEEGMAQPPTTQRPWWRFWA
jgi:excisionase family DNA binding protein